MNILDIAQNGVFSADAARGVLHVTMGVFFAASGWNKLTNSERHKSLVETFKRDGVPLINFNQWWVPAWELAGGGMLLTGIFPAFAAAVLLAICTVATLCEGQGRVAAYAPINEADRVADWLYLPEVLYGIILFAIVLGA